MAAGLCECGCGQKTMPARQTAVSKGWIKGEPVRYVCGHAGGSKNKRRGGHLRRELAVEHKRLWMLEAPEVPYGMCQCGCGATTPVSNRTRAATRRVRGEPVRYVNGHGRRNRVRRSVDYIEEDRGYETPCLIWQGPIKRGYGVIARNDRPHVLAHRAAFERAHGRIEVGKVIHHLCEIKSCCNPGHLATLGRQEHIRLHKPHPSRCAERQSRDESDEDVLSAQWSCLGRMEP